MPTLASLMNSAKEMAGKRLELLILLAVLAGLLTGILYRPAVDVMNSVVAALGTQSSGDANYQQAAEILLNDAETLILGQLSLIVISGFLLPFWARASAPAGLIPGEGGINAFFSRGVLATKFLLIATALTISSFVVVAPITALLSQILGSFALAAGGILILWLSFAWSAAANTAIILSIENQHVTFRAAWLHTKVFIRPIVGTYAAFWLIAGVINLLLNNLATQSLPEAIAAPLSLIISGTVSYGAAALHVSCLFSLPNTKTHQEI